MLKYTEKGQEGRSKRLEELRKRVTKLKLLNSHKDTDSWDDLKNILEGFVESERNEKKHVILAQAMGGYPDPENPRYIKKETESRLVGDARVSFEREMAFQLVIDLIEKTDEQIEHVENTIREIEMTYKEAKAQLQ